MGTAPPPWPHPCPCGAPPVRHAALLDVGDDEGFPSLSAGCCGAGETPVNLIWKGSLLKVGPGEDTVGSWSHYFLAEWL